jgi:exodeoxyribonuclease VII large subunit
MAKKETIPVFSVAQLNALIKGALDNSLPGRFLLRGQISDWKRHSSGHCYFSLKDAESQIPGVMWASKARGLKFACENGMEVIATGSVEVYVPGGKYQFYAEKLEPAGIGSLQLAFEQMRQRLEAEGFFRPEHKKPIPPYAMRIGVVTSRTGAAIVDISESIFHRWPCARLSVFDVPVQGEGSAAKIAAAIARANRLRQLGLQILIVGRGGGSMEDLWAFNEEVVARAIYNSRIPVISAVGHEVDVTIADLVADARASTPTRAGMIAVPDMREVLHRLETAAARLERSAVACLQRSRMRLETILASSVFRTPYGPVRIAAQRLDERVDALADGMNERLNRMRRQVDAVAATIARIEPGRVIAQQRLRLYDLGARGQRAMLAVLSKKQLQLTAQENRVQALNPRSVLSRGYSMTLNRRTGAVITDVAQVAAGDGIVTELAGQRRFESTVTKVDQRPYGEETN